MQCIYYVAKNESEKIEKQWRIQVVVFELDLWRRDSAQRDSVSVWQGADKVGEDFHRLLGGR